MTERPNEGRVAFCAPVTQQPCKTGFEKNTQQMQILAPNHHSWLPAGGKISITVDCILIKKRSQYMGRTVSLSLAVLL